MARRNILGKNNALELTNWSTNIFPNFTCCYGHVNIGWYQYHGILREHNTYIYYHIVSNILHRVTIRFYKC